MIIQQNNKGQYTITLPKAIVQGMKWGKGQELTVEIIEKGRIILKER
jgi:bifunctional DNA-binding transcriptional regulator/antitoxin component of YhaV-PrlF toxin-antitoxin module